MTKLKMFKRITVCDQNGKVEYDSGLMPTRSYVIAFLKSIYGEFDDVTLSVKDTSGGSSNIQAPSSGSVKRMATDAPDDNDNYGIVVGTGNTAEDNEDYKIDTQIDHGTGAGELDYGAHSFTAPSVVGSNIDMVVSRDFYNGSGSSITVNEIGIYCVSTSANNYHCLARDVLGTPVVVDDTKTLTVQYTVRTVV